MTIKEINEKMGAVSKKMHDIIDGTETTLSEEKRADEESHKAQKGLYNGGGHDIAVHAYRRDSPWMKDMSKFVLQHPVDDAKPHTLETTTGTARTGSRKHHKEQHGHELNRPNGIVNGRQSRGGL